MKKYIMVAITLLVLNSCETKNSSKISTNITISGKEILIYIIDSCEYIFIIWCMAELVDA